MTSICAVEAQARPLPRHWRSAGSSRAARVPAFSAALPVTKVWREAEVLPASGVIAVSPLFSRKAASGRPSASAAICAMTVLEPWPISTAPWCSTTAPSAEMPSLMVEGLGSEVLPQPYQHEATPTPRRDRCSFRVEGLGVGKRAPPMRLQRLEAIGNADALLEHAGR